MGPRESPPRSPRLAPPRPAAGGFRPPGGVEHERGHQVLEHRAASDHHTDAHRRGLECTLPSQTDSWTPSSGDPYRATKAPTRSAITVESAASTARCRT